jgi:hypothetical protein
MAKLFVVLLLCVAYVVADLYMHNPRGSNDRLNEANTARNNGNRLFDSQNNAQGGYCIGPAMTFYEGSMLSIEWTNQHGCGSNPKLQCNLVVQYMCGSTSDDPTTLIRDGVTTNTIPATTAGATDMTGGNYTYGMHESLQSYLNCQTRTRNMGLFIADRAAQGSLTPARAASIYTRQNNAGTRNGLECPEERDYYPYWHPSQWKDIAILTTDTSFCSFYQANSQNVMGKGYCYSSDINVQTADNNPSDCSASGNTWTNAPAFGLSAPDCGVVPWSRENHLGNGVTGFANSYNMTMPSASDLSNCINDDSCVCVLRLRYNISSIEAGFPDMSRPDYGFIDWTYNAEASPVQDDPVLNVTDGSGLQVELALDTTQYGRTFQDRSYTFKISNRPSGVSASARLYNLNVRGKRGNIVQTYPATEYDFVPQYLYTRVGDYIHFQWTGCDTNPAGNAGEGTAQTDRSNIVQIPSANQAYPITDAWIASNHKSLLFEDASTRIRFATLDQTNCQTRAQLQAAGVANVEGDVQNCGKLNAASPYFDGGVIKMNKTGTFNYMNTRNHNFTNRDQKGIIYVVPLLPSWAVGVVVTGSVLFVGAAAVSGMMFYAKSHPHSSIANLFSKL